jgi:hypothetical protein
MLRPNATARKTPTWPTPTPEQVSVILLGTYHMDNPGLDDVNVTADDVLGADRQEEIETLVSHLEASAPDWIAVERPAARDETVDHLYAQYREGTYEYGEEHEFDPPHPGRDGETMECRSEVVQVGFRLADRLGHDSVLPVDVPEALGRSEGFEALDEQGVDTSPKIDVPRIDTQKLETTMRERLASSTVTEYHRFINEEAALHANDGMFDRFLRHGDGDNYAGPDALAKWYRRNLRMVHNIWQGVDEDTDRVLFLVGNGHVHILRHLLIEFPQFCPVSPLRYLPRGNR